MNILSTQFDLPSRSLDIFLAGCRGPHCKNCHNPESHDFNQGKRFVSGDFWAAVDLKVQRFPKLVERFRVMGGEPLDQPEEELCSLLSVLAGFEKEIWLFTGHELREVPRAVRSLCDYIKCGRYLEWLRRKTNVQYGVTLASFNQNVYRAGVDY